MAAITSIADLRELARRRVPLALFDYVDGGSYDEVTLRRNREDFDAIQLRPRALIDVARQQLATTLLGAPAATLPGCSRSSTTGRRFSSSGRSEAGGCCSTRTSAASAGCSC